MNSKLSAQLKYGALAIWFLFTIALASWICYFSFKQTVRLSSLNIEATSELIRHQRMLLMEGSFLLLCLLAGFLVIAYFIFRDIQQNKKLRSFLLTFTHELKTPIASIQLQAESLHEDLGSTPHSSLIQRLVSDTNRLNMHLENSLFLAEDSNRQYYFEELSLKETIDEVLHYWPKLKIDVANDCVVRVDKRAFESLIKNILQNSFVHGQATEVRIQAEAASQRYVKIKFIDNGRGFDGNLDALGKLFERHYSGSGSGIGLHLVRELVAIMKGAVVFQSSPNGFVVNVTLIGEMK